MERHDSLAPIRKKQPEIKKEIVNVKVNETPKEQEIIHIVQQGETLYKIARKYRTSVLSLVKKNNLPTNKIRVGQELKI